MTGVLIAGGVILALLTTVLLKQWVEYQRVLKGERDFLGEGTPQGGPRGEAPARRRADA